jgi:RNA polymerase sigma-70 factor (ECF subfamily)
MKRSGEACQEFVDLVFQHQGVLHRICSVYGPTPEDRDDLYQEILTHAWRSFASFSKKAKFSTWLYRVALNTAFLSRRKRSAQPEFVTSDGDAPEAAVYENAGRQQDVELLYRCIQELKTLDRAIVLLYLEQHTYEEIAEITGLSRSNISVRLVRIKEKLRRLLLAKGYREG